MNEILEEFKQWEEIQIWPNENAEREDLTEAIFQYEDIEKLAEEHELVLSTNPMVFRKMWGDIRSIFQHAATGLGAAHKRAHPGKPPKLLTTGKHGYRIRKWVK